MGSEMCIRDRSFFSFCDRNSILLHVTDVRAPWQNGRTERHGDIFKHLFAKALYLYPSRDLGQLRTMIAECNAAKNRMSNRSGYSPLQRVFGFTTRLPADLTSDDKYAPDIVFDAASCDVSFEQAREIRKAAMQAHALVSVRDRVDHAVRARHRRPAEIKPHDLVMVWKVHNPSISKRGKWVGPGTCIGVSRGSVWVNMRGSLWKCAQVQCKVATTEEHRGLEVMNDLLDDMKAKFKTGSNLRFTDVTNTGPPESPSVSEEQEGPPPRDNPEQASPEYQFSEHGEPTPVVPEGSNTVTGEESVPSLVDPETLSATSPARSNVSGHAPTDEPTDLDMEEFKSAVHPRDDAESIEPPAQRPRLEDNNPSSSVRWFPSQEGDGKWVAHLMELLQSRDTEKIQSFFQEVCQSESDDPVDVFYRKLSSRLSETEDERRQPDQHLSPEDEQMRRDLIDDRFWENSGKPIIFTPDEGKQIFGDTKENVYANLVFSVDNETKLTNSRVQLSLIHI